MTDKILDWSSIALVSLILWWLAYRDHSGHSMLDRLIRGPRWLTYLACRPGQEYIDVHGVVGQILAMSMLVIITILVFVADDHDDRIAIWALATAGIAILMLFAIGILKWLYGVKHK